MCCDDYLYSSDGKLKAMYEVTVSTSLQLGDSYLFA